MEAENKFIPPHPLKTPVLFLVFNRFDTTKKVFAEIRKAKPPRLYIASDGARDDRSDEIKKVEIVRKYIISNIDWKCEVKTLFRKKNLGCKYAVSGAIDWFFENEEMGIILEDDCLPAQSFFWYCEELLERYKDDLRVGQISGFNYGYENKDRKYSYIFSKYPMIWGWATWKNRWSNYSLTLNNLKEIESNKQFELIFTRGELRERMGNFKRSKNGSIDTWDYQWSFALYKNSQFSIIPRHNFILNLGFGDDSTHTTGINPYKELKLSNTSNKIKHPKYIIQHKELYRKINSTRNIIRRVINKIVKK